MSFTKVAIAGVSSEVGKTTLLCDLLREFPGWEAIKMTRGHYRSCGKDPHACCVSHLLGDAPLVRSGFQQTYASDKDTGRYWDAGFAQLGFPLSRLVHADPKGRNAGWTAYLYYGFDEALPQDARRFAPVRGRSDLFSGNIQYKLNSWVTFAFEQGYYRTRAANRSALDFGGLPLFRGIPSYTSHNLRSEFATIFTF